MKKLNIVQLYPAEMNIYGDFGNVQIIQKRAQLYGYQPKIMSYEPGVDLDILNKADIVLGGGGQDSGQRKIIDDLAKIKPTLLKLASDGAVMLMICGLYQLFGHYFESKDGDRMTGIGLFDMVTVGGDKRMIGNITINNDELGDLVGYENHSGVTTLADGQLALGRVVRGDGNDGRSGREGAIKYNVYGSYLHGPILSKNSQLADRLIQLAVRRKYGDERLSPASQQAIEVLHQLQLLTNEARTIAIKRPR